MQIGSALVNLDDSAIVKSWGSVPPSIDIISPKLRVFSATVGWESGPIEGASVRGLRLVARQLPDPAPPDSMVVSEQEVFDGTDVVVTRTYAPAPPVPPTNEEEIAQLKRENAGLRDALIAKAVVTQAEIDAKTPAAVAGRP